MTVGTFNLSAPAFPLATESMRPAHATPRSQGFVQRRAIIEREVRVYTLRWPLGGFGERAMLWDLWESTAGGTLDLDYTTKDGEAIRVFMSEPDITQRSAVLCECSVELEEVL